MFESFDVSPAWQGIGEIWTAEETDPLAPPGEFPEEEVEYPDLEATYVLLPEEPGYDTMYDQAGDWLEQKGGMLEQFQIFPVNFS